MWGRQELCAVPEATLVFLLEIEHIPSCPYVESRREYDEARKVADDLERALAAIGPEEQDND